MTLDQSPPSKSIDIRESHDYRKHTASLSRGIVKMESHKRSWSTMAESSSRRRWIGAYEHHVELGFSLPGKPTDNAKIESFNGRFRAECLNVIGSCLCPMPSVKSRRGGSTITRRVSTSHWGGQHSLTSPSGRGFPPNLFHRSRNFH